MGCGGCMGARTQVVGAVRHGDIYGAVQGFRQAGQVIMEKVRGTYDESRYAGISQTPAVRATPYQRPPERST